MKKYDRFAISSTIKDLRENKKLTQFELAEKLEISTAHYSQIEQGRHGMSLDVLFEIMNFFDVDANTILGVSGQPSYGMKSLDKLIVRMTKLNENDRKYIINAWKVVLDSFLRGREVAA